MAMFRLVTLGLMAFGLGGLAGQIARTRGWMSPQVQVSVRVPVPDTRSGVGRASSVMTRRDDAQNDEDAESVGSSPAVDSPAERAHAVAEQAVADISIQYAAEYAAEAAEYAAEAAPQDTTASEGKPTLVFEFNDVVFADRRRRVRSFLRRVLASWCRLGQRPAEIYLRHEHYP